MGTDLSGKPDSELFWFEKYIISLMRSQNGISINEPVLNATPEELEAIKTYAYYEDFRSFSG